MSEKPVTLADRFAIQKLFKTGERIGRRPLLVIFKKNDLGYNRYLYCPDKTCPSAVTRNKVKRLLRVHVREFNPKLYKGLDLGFVTSVSFVKLSFQERNLMITKTLSRFLQ
ncbi:MAG: ribonuclease P protein component [Leptospiraceae bacterium]|nr:ribonuclease P protein component [Leptospiraceae bacterium]